MKSRARFLTVFFSNIAIVLTSSLLEAQTDDPTPTVDIGASVFIERCTLCHGSDGMGEGVLALKIKDYPDTNLRKGIKAKTRKDIHSAVVFGGSRGDYSVYMPPMGNELTWTEIESVIDFVSLLRSDFKQADKLLKTSSLSQKPSKKIGKQVFDSRCVLCHGKFGEGDGRMAKVIKNPPPANLVRSRLPDDYLEKIISEGGEGVSRSPQMPPWGMQLDQFELDSVILYIKSIRE